MEDIDCCLIFVYVKVLINDFEVSKKSQKYDKCIKQGTDISGGMTNALTIYTRDKCLFRYSSDGLDIFSKKL